MPKSGPRLTSPIRNLDALRAVQMALDKGEKGPDAQPAAAKSSGRMDRHLFLPLTDFLANDRYKPKEFLRWVLRNRLPFHSRILDEDYAAGFLMEWYVKWSLFRFSADRQYLFTLNSSSNGILGNGTIYRTGPGWNVSFIRPDEPPGRRAITEIDIIGEYHEGDVMKPIIFEIKSSKCLDENKIRLLSAIRRRIELVSEIYHTEPYVCVVRPVWIGEDPGFRTEDYPGISELRYVLTPPAPHLRELAKLLEEGFPREGWERKTAKKIRAVLALTDGPTTVERFMNVTGVTGNETSDLLFKLWEGRYLEFWKRDGTLEFALGEKGRVLVDPIVASDSEI